MKTAIAEQQKTPVNDFNARRNEFESATRGVSFTKDFNPSLEALMNDPLETYAARVSAWTKRKAWGNQCLYCVNADGSPAFQVDCVRDLKISKQTVCHAVSYLVGRGRLEMRGTAKLLYPVISPDLAKSQTKGEEVVKESGEYATFLEDWKVAHSSDFAELEVARSTVERLRKVILTGYREWRAARTNPVASLLKESKESLKESAPPPPPVSLEPEPRKEEEEEVVLQSTEKQTQTPRPPDLYDEFKAAYPKERFDESKARPLFRALPQPVQQRAIARLRQRYLTCERWLDEAGKWIPLASNWLKEKQYDADPPPKWSKQQQARGKSPTLDDILALRRQRQGTT